MNLAFLRETKTGVSVQVRVQPRARKTEIVGVHGDALKIKVAAPPVDGAANEELINFFSKLLKLGKSKVHVSQGAHSRTKVVQIEGFSVPQFTETLIREKLIAIQFG